MVNLEQLSLFIDIVDKGSFSAVARLRNKSVSTVSYSIGQLESYLDVLLLDRTTKFPTLTVDGKIIYDSAKLLLSQTQKLDSAARDLVNGVEEQLAVGIEELLPLSLVEAELAKVANAYPNTKLTVKRGNRDDLWRALQSGSLDLALIPGSHDGGSITKCSINLVAIRAPDHIIKERNQYSPATGLFVLCQSITLLLETSLEGLNALPIPRIKCTTLEDAVSLVTQGYGWSLVPVELTKEFHQAQKVVTFDSGLTVSEHAFPVYMLSSGSSIKGPVHRYVEALFSKAPSH
ncbi:LysR family transcriptional regulator [Vibrio sp. ZSDZ34]|uniref:LysR family transcriptional regulator n=1 Tax=Vibrio gelatinilyticus TaxID=2893468 RepID=A0A9X2AW17_9VIBR|nr:LysR family transcriptional regulator [Vibrio gelatinilyticus]MCJ2377469.1 LysR family transcriptional regulator [Vibrio gelatinilyticus]